jgi:hypothetical protein
MRTAFLSLLTILCLVLAVAPATAQYTLYSNGPYNGTTEAWPINFGFTVSDSYVLLGGNYVTGMNFVYWDVSNSDTLTSVGVAFTRDPNPTSGFTPYGATNTALNGGRTNQYGYYLFEATLTGIPGQGPVYLGYVTLGNACTVSGCSTPIYWDENSGIDCDWYGCPSTAYENEVGSIPSESFTLTGIGDIGLVPEPSSILLFGSGILGLAGVLRRKVNI